MAINKATPRIVWDRNLIQKAKFPREVIPLSMVFSHLFHFIISWSLLIIFLLITQGWYFFSITAILQQIIGIVLLLIFASGISLITSALTVFYRDIKFMVQLGIMLWFYATPVIYPFTQIPNQYQWIFYLNPLTGIFSLLKQPITEHSLPLVIVTGQAIFIFIVLLLGITIFRKREKFFADYL
jgi:ABC-type polysaccharide/polyol phosphate export permease